MKDKMFTLGERLTACADFVRPGSVAADIGTDHAKLPVWLVYNGVIPSAVASDINEGPIESARKNIEAYGLSDKIITFTGDGLQTLTPDMAQDIIIAGMGGELIAAILGAAAWVKNPAYRLILQPMTHPERLRAWLFSNGFSIIDERAACEAGKVYTVICAEFSGEIKEYSEAEAYIGGLAGKTDDTSRRFLQRQAHQLRVSAEGIRAAGEEETAVMLESLAAEVENGKLKEIVM